MNYIIKGLAFALIPLIVSGVLALMRKTDKNAKKGKVHLPKFFLVFGSVASGIFLIPTFITLFSNQPIWTSILFFLFSLIGSSLIIAYFNCRITYDENGFTSKSFWGFKRKYQYNQITGIKYSMHETYLYIGKKRVMIDEFAKGQREFISCAKKGYRKVNNGKAIPEISKTKNDIFNGNVEDVGGFLFAYISVAVLAVGFLIFTIVSTFLPITAENTVKHQVQFVSSVMEDDALIMTTTENVTYKVFGLTDSGKIESIKSVCNKSTLLDVYSKEVNSKEKGHYFTVKAIKNNGKDILSFDETNKIHRERNWPFILMAGGMCLLWFIFVFFSIMIGRNPKKFSKRTVGLFFKNGYIKD